MVTFENVVINKTVENLIKGEDYREEIVNEINVTFLDFAIDFFKKIVKAKIDVEAIDLNWYRKNFINNENMDPADCAICAGINKKTVTNIYGTAKKDIILDVANSNFEYLASIINELETDSDSGLAISIKISYKDITVELSLTESLLVINALATKKIAIRGGAWSSIEKKVEKPLVDKLCTLCNVPPQNIDNKVFHKNESLDFDREVDYKLIDKNGNVNRVEVKLMGQGNPESADAAIARDSQIFIADTLSEQNKNHLLSLGIKYLELKNNKNIINDFKAILSDLNIPYSD